MCAVRAPGRCNYGSRPGAPARSTLSSKEVEHGRGRSGGPEALRLCEGGRAPGTSKWNKIEHRLFCHITENWRGRPLADLDTIVQLIGSTRTRTGLRVKAGLDTHLYEKGLVIPDADIEALQLHPHKFHGEWNYSFTPRTK